MRTAWFPSIRPVCEFLFALCAALCLHGCERSTAARAPEGGEPPKIAGGAENALPSVGAPLLDGFEGPQHTVWAFDSADDEGDAKYVADGATQGKKALSVSLRGAGTKGKVHLRRDVELDLTRASALVLDVTSPSDKFSLALALKSDPGDIYQEAKYFGLKAGLNKDVRFPLEGKTWKNAESNWEYAGPPVNLKGVKRLMLLVYTNGESAGTFLFDNLRVEGGEQGGDAYREWRPEILLSSPLPAAAAQFQGIEMQAVFRASYRDIFDEKDVAIGLRVNTPSGKFLDVRGFFAGLARYPGKLPGPGDAAAPPPLWGPFKDDPAAGAGKSGGAGAAPEKPSDGSTLPLWLVRFTPLETGRYTLQLYVRNAVGETRAPEQAMVVAPEAREAAPPGRRGGNVRIARSDPRMLELMDGAPFFVFGQNVCWTQDWAPYLKKIQAYGGNTCRVWLCPWGANLERKTEPGSYDLKTASRLDDLMAQAESSGVRIVFCFTFHGATGDFWHESAYNLANGGPCARAEDFFTNSRARTQFKRLLSYASARWGSSPALLSWELMNEMDLSKFDSGADVSAWSREMAAHLKNVDAHGHLVTTSSTRTRFQFELWRDASIDFVCMHGYGADVSALVYDYISPFGAHHKPALLAEFGGGWNPQDDIPDKDGARLQAALWLTACSPSCGLALPWWWDTYIEARDLYPLLAAAGRFMAGDDRRGRFGEWARKRYGAVEVCGVMDNQGARLYVHNPEWTRVPESRGKVLLEAPQPLELSGMLDGAYTVEIWDAREGKIAASFEAAASAGELKFDLPARAAEFGVKADRKQRLKPELK